MTKYEVRITVTITRAQNALLQEWATEEDRPVSGVIRRLIDDEQNRRIEQDQRRGEEGR